MQGSQRGSTKSEQNRCVYLRKNKSVSTHSELEKEAVSKQKRRMSFILKRKMLKLEDGRKKKKPIYQNYVVLLNKKNQSLCTDVIMNA